MHNLKVYLAGKVDPESKFAGSQWREQYCTIIASTTGREVVNLNPSRGTMRFPLDEGDPTLIFGRDCFMIRECDLVIVNLSDDISVGGSQEMLIAKYFGKPLLGLASKDGKFRKSLKTINNTEYEDWVHPFVALPSDIIFGDIYELADHLRSNPAITETRAKDMAVVDQAIKYYMDKVLEQSVVIQ